MELNTWIPYNTTFYVWLESALNNLKYIIRTIVCEAPCHHIMSFSTLLHNKLNILISGQHWDLRDCFADNSIIRTYCINVVTNVLALNLTIFSFIPHTWFRSTYLTRELIIKNEMQYTKDLGAYETQHITRSSCRGFRKAECLPP